MVWGCACGFGSIVTLFLSLFPLPQSIDSGNLASATPHTIYTDLFET